MFSKRLPINDIKAIIQSMLKSYLYLDESKPEGLDARFKFSNNFLGVTQENRQFLNELADAILVNPEQFKVSKKEDLLQLIDVLVLYSNHLDQQTSAEMNSCLSKEQKESTVLYWLRAAKTLCTDYTKDMLHPDNSRELSSFAQFKHYFGKALRYVKECTLADRLLLLQQAVEMAKYLQGLNNPKELDPHGYSGRITTYQLPVVYALRDLKQFDEAATIMQEQLKNAPDRFLQIQSNLQLALICKEKYQQTHQEPAIAAAILYAKTANELAKNESNPVARFNAKVALMECYELENKKEEATEIANEILEAVEKDSNCGAKALHIEAAKKTIQNQMRIQIR